MSQKNCTKASVKLKQTFCRFSSSVVAIKIPVSNYWAACTCSKWSSLNRSNLWVKSQVGQSKDLFFSVFLRTKSKFCRTPRVNMRDAFWPQLNKTERCETTTGTEHDIVTPKNTRNLVAFPQSNSPPDERLIQNMLWSRKTILINDRFVRWWMDILFWFLEYKTLRRERN